MDTSAHWFKEDQQLSSSLNAEALLSNNIFELFFRVEEYVGAHSHVEIVYYLTSAKLWLL